jgi:hypothetical protein
MISILAEPDHERDLAMAIRSRSSIGVWLAAVILPATIGTAALVSADASARADAPAPQDCVLDAATGAERCFEDFRTAVSFATDGVIADAPIRARDAVTDQAFTLKVATLALGAPAAATENRASSVVTTDNSVIGATLFTGTNFTGDSETIRIPQPCVKDGSYDYGLTLGTVGRAAESLQPWADCWIWLHSGDGWDSPRQGPFKEGTADLGDWKRHAVLMGLS